MTTRPVLGLVALRLAAIVATGCCGSACTRPGAPSPAWQATPTASAPALIGADAGNATAVNAPPGGAALASLRPALRRGFNLGNALDAPNEGDWGVVLAASDFVGIKQAGFDHVRLPARFSAHAAESAPYAISPDFLARVDWAIDNALANGLAIVLDFHHYKEMMERPDDNRARFVAIWRQLAERYRARPESVVFELLNEPSDKLTADQWNGTLAEALAAVRASNPTRAVVVEGIFWASAHNLRYTLKLPKDPNLVGSFHMYQPILLTHQGASFMPPEYDTVGIVFPGPPSQPVSPGPGASRVDWVTKWLKRYNEQPAATNPSGPATIAEEMDLAQGFAEATHLPVYMGEFGCIDRADARTRELWVRETRKQAESRGFGWAYWDDGGAFKAYDRASRSWVPYLKSALLD
ncbi:MAG TPA: glycoside hydrolase family 5 protein [Polyangiaceae bacterium]|nr:glycoside hydrolase family 5 protein [Polyangiaceae bacterium]